MAHQHYRSPFGDTTYTKVFVGGLAWETPSEVMHSYFDQFGEILEAVIITDKHTGKSKGYGFVTFRDHESAKRACIEPNPVIDGRRANCNIASLGRPRPSPPRGRTNNQLGNIYQGGGGTAYQPLPRPQPLPPPASPVIYPPYGYTAYPTDYGYHQTMYNPHIQQAQYYNQLYQGGSSSTMGAPYYYVQAGGAGARAGTFSLPHSPQQRFQGPTASYLYYPAPPAPDSGSNVYPPPPQALPLSQATTTRLTTESSSGTPPPTLPISTQTQPAVAAAAAAPTTSTSSSTT